MTAVITICDTCRVGGWEAGSTGATSGSALADLIEVAAEGHPALTTRRHACLMACETPCAVALQSDGKMSYALAGFAPSLGDADAIVAFAVQYAASRSGVVPWANWPEAVKGRFQARLPPLPSG